MTDAFCLQLATSPKTPETSRKAKVRRLIRLNYRKEKYSKLWQVLHLEHNNTPKWNKNNRYLWQVMVVDSDS